MPEAQRQKHGPVWHAESMAVTDLLISLKISSRSKSARRGMEIAFANSH
jgi:hypothetical protein